MCGRDVIDSNVLSTPMHRAGLGLPPSPRPCGGTYDEATRFRLKLNLFRKTGFVEE
jgi:hypothetical protein